MESDNLEVWERGLTTSERSILISNFVAVANDEVMKNESSCLSCFRRCGVLLTLDGTGDELIKPQGCKNFQYQFQKLLTKWKKITITPWRYYNQRIGIVV